MAKRMTVDEILESKLGYNTKSFGESYSNRELGNDRKPFSMGETINALVTIKSDRTIMIAEAASLKADILSMKARGEGLDKIMDKVQHAATTVWETIKKLLLALLDLIKNFFRKFGSREKQLDKIIREIETVLNAKNSSRQRERLKETTFKLPPLGDTGAMSGLQRRLSELSIGDRIQAIGDRIQDNEDSGVEFQEVEEYNGMAEMMKKFKNAGEKFSSPTKESIIKYLEMIVPGSSSKDMDLKTFENKLGEYKKDLKRGYNDTKKTLKEYGKKSEDVRGGNKAYIAAKEMLQEKLIGLKMMKKARIVESLKGFQKSLKTTLANIKNGINLDSDDAHLTQKIRVVIPKVSKGISAAIGLVESLYAVTFKHVGMCIAVLRQFKM